jgi:hypothetical protein
MRIIPALERQRQEDQEFKVFLGYRVRPSLKRIEEEENVY